MRENNWHRFLACLLCVCMLLTLLPAGALAAQVEEHATTQTNPTADPEPPVEVDPPADSEPPVETDPIEDTPSGVAMVDGVSYSTLAEAIRAVQAEGETATTVSLLNDVTENITIPVGKKVVLTSAEAEHPYTLAGTVTNRGELALDSIKITGRVNTYGDLTAKVGSTILNSEGYGVVVYGGTFTKTGGFIETNANAAIYVPVDTTAQVNLTDVTVFATTSCLDARSGAVTICGGTYISAGSGARTIRVGDGSTVCMADEVTIAAEGDKGIAIQGVNCNVTFEESFRGTVFGKYRAVYGVATPKGYVEKNIANGYILEPSGVAYNGTTGYTYATLKQAISAVAADGAQNEIQILRTPDATESISIPVEKNILLDLGGNEIGGAIVNYGVLAMQNGTFNGTIQSRVTAVEGAETVRSQLTMTGVTVHAENATTALTVYGDATLTNVNVSANSRCVYATDGAVVKIVDGNYSVPSDVTPAASVRTILAAKGSQVTIAGATQVISEIDDGFAVSGTENNITFYQFVGEFRSQGTNGRAVYGVSLPNTCVKEEENAVQRVYNKRAVRNETTGCWYSTLQQAIDDATDGEQTVIQVQEALTESITVPSGKNVKVLLTATTLTGTITNEGALSVEGGTMIGSITSTGELSLENVVVDGSSQSIALTMSGKTTLTNVEVSGITRCLRANAGAEVTVIGGRYTAGGDSARTIYAYEGSTVTITGPIVITANGMSGIAVQGAANTVNFTTVEDDDGTYYAGISGGFHAVYGVATPEGYLEQQGEGVMVLRQNGVAFNETTGHTYSSLKTAISKATVGEPNVISLLADPAEEAISIAAGKEIVLNLNEHTLNGAVSNAGSLTLKNGTITARITNTDGATSLVLENVAVLPTTGYGVIIRSGEVTITGGSIKSMDNGAVGITAGEGTLKIDGATLEGTKAVDLREAASYRASITSGMFTGRLSILGENNELTITGGTFNEKPDVSFLSKGYVIFENEEDSTYEVAQGFTITVEGGTANGKTVATVKPGEAVQMVANAPEDGMVFTGWKDDSGRTVHTHIRYTFWARSDMTLTATYAREEEEPVIPPVVFGAPDTYTYSDQGMNCIVINFSRNINGKDYALVEYGALYGLSKSQFGDHIEELADRLSATLEGTTLVPKDKVKVSVGTSTKSNGTYGLVINVGAMTENVVYARGYVVIQNRETKEYSLVMSDICYRNFNETVSVIVPCATTMDVLVPAKPEQ